MNGTLVSVIIPTYNKITTIERAIKSVLNQTHPNFELIIMDDGSTDETYKVCEKYQNDIIYIPNDENVGSYKTRIDALEYINGDYVMYVDADDWLEENALKRCMITAKNTPADVIQMRINRRITKYGIAIPYRSKYNMHMALESLMYDERLYPVACWGKLYTRKILEDAKFLPYDGFWGDDRIFNLAVFEQKPDLALNMKAVYNYVWGGESETFKPENINDYVGTYETKCYWAKQHGYERYIPLMQKELIKLLYHFVDRMIDSDELDEDDMISFLRNELKSSPWCEFKELETPLTIYENSLRSDFRIYKRKLRSYL